MRERQEVWEGGEGCRRGRGGVDRETSKEKKLLWLPKISRSLSRRAGSDAAARRVWRDKAPRGFVLCYCRSYCYYFTASLFVLLTEGREANTSPGNGLCCYCLGRSFFIVFIFGPVLILSMCR